MRANTGDRRVEPVGSRGLDASGEVLRLDRRDRTHVDDGLALGQRCGNAAVAEQHLLHIGRVGHHRERHFSCASHVGRRPANDRARVEQRLRHRTAGVHEELVPCNSQVARHRRAHDAQADESEFHGLVSEVRNAARGR
jgi:hypothetical protein